MRTTNRLNGKLDRLDWVIASSDIAAILTLGSMVLFHLNGLALLILIGLVGFGLFARNRRLILEARLAEVEARAQ